jgi:hypothetical protein
LEDKLDKANKELVSLKTADHEHPREDKTIGVQQLRIELGRVLANRGRIWTKCDKKKAATLPSGLMRVDVGSDDAAAFAKNMLLYAFEEGDEQTPGKYLGEFRVEAASDKDKLIQLDSTTQMPKSIDPKVKLLADNVMESKGPWVLYETIPTDEHEAFANLTEDQKKGVPDEFLKDGQPGPDGKKFERPLRDYLAIFRACEVHRTLFADRWESARRDLEYLDATSKDAESQLAAAEKEKTQVGKERQRAKTELLVVTNLNAARQNMLKMFQGLVQQAIANNLKYAQEIARLQKEAADLIDRRTREMAQFGPRTN